MPQKTLKVVPAPLVSAAATSAPPALEDRTPTVDYMCGRCGAVLMHADENRVHSLIIHCTVCDAYNSTDADVPSPFQSARFLQWLIAPCGDNPGTRLG